MISHYIIEEMTCSYKIVCIFLLCMVRHIFFGIKVIRRFIGLTYENIAKMENNIFNVPNNLNMFLACRKKEKTKADPPNTKTGANPPLYRSPCGQVISLHTQVLPHTILTGVFECFYFMTFLYNAK